MLIKFLHILVVPEKKEKKKKKHPYSPNRSMQMSSKIYRYNFSGGGW